MILNDKQSIIFQKIIKRIYSDDINNDYILKIAPLINDILDSHYVAAFFLPNRFVKEMQFISNNPSDFYDAYMPVSSYDYLLNTLVNKNSPAYLHDLIKGDYKGKRDFEEAVQRVRPVSDVTYIPIQVNQSLSGYIAVGRAGAKNRIFSKNENEIFSFISGFITEGFRNSLYIKPDGDDTAIINGKGQILIAGDRIDAAFEELFGERFKYTPKNGFNQNSFLFGQSLQDFQNPLIIHKNSNLWLKDKNKIYHFSLKNIASPSYRPYFLTEPQTLITLYKDDDFPERADIHDFTKLSLVYGLTPRENDVIRLIYKGFSNKDISIRLKISESTVKHHIWNIFNKTGVDSRTQLLFTLSS